MRQLQPEARNAGNALQLGDVERHGCCIPAYVWWHLWHPTSGGPPGPGHLGPSQGQVTWVLAAGGTVPFGAVGPLPFDPAADFHSLCTVQDNGCEATSEYDSVMSHDTTHHHMPLALLRIHNPWQSCFVPWEHSQNSGGVVAFVTNTQGPLPYLTWDPQDSPFVTQQAVDTASCHSIASSA